MAFKKDILYSRLLGDIRSGILEADTRLPPEKELAEAYGVGRVTLRSALSELEAAGLVTRLPGRGTVVTGAQPPKDMRSLLILTEFKSSVHAFQNYIIPEVIRFVRECHCNPILLERGAFENLTLDDIKVASRRENLVGVVALMNHFTGREPVLHQLQHLHLPVVLAMSAARDPEITGFPGVGICERDALEATILYLSRRPVHSIAFLSDDRLPDFRGWLPEELPGLLERYGLYTRPDWFKRTGADPMKLTLAAEELYASSPRPDLLLCYTSYYAIYLYPHLKSLGVRIPDDLSIMGLCGYQGTRFLNPLLNTMNFHYERVAEKAVRLALNPSPEKSGRFFEIKSTVSPGGSIKKQ